jgi:hypothetical protein
MRHAILSLLLVTGCAAETGTEFPGLSGERMTCDAARYDFIVDQPRSVLAGVRFDEPVRVIAPGDAVTQDFSPDRINIHVDELGIIRRLSCG